MPAAMPGRSESLPLSTLHKPSSAEHPDRSNQQMKYERVRPSSPASVLGSEVCTAPRQPACQQTGKPGGPTGPVPIRYNGAYGVWNAGKGIRQFLLGPPGAMAGPHPWATHEQAVTARVNGAAGSTPTAVGPSPAAAPRKHTAAGRAMQPAQPTTATCDLPRTGIRTKCKKRKERAQTPWPAALRAFMDPGPLVTPPRSRTRTPNYMYIHTCDVAAKRTAPAQHYNACRRMPPRPRRRRPAAVGGQSADRDVRACTRCSRGADVPAGASAWGAAARGGCWVRRVSVGR